MMLLLLLSFKKLNVINISCGEEKLQATSKLTIYYYFIWHLASVNIAPP